MALRLEPCGVTSARQYVARWHRHNEPPTGAIVCAVVVDPDGWARGVAMLGRPVSPALQAQGCLEINRVATDGTRNACSMLYGWGSREARRRGANRLVTYTLETEPGTSLLAAGWVVTGVTKPRKSGWSNRNGRRQQVAIGKTRWEPQWSALVIRAVAVADAGRVLAGGG